MNSQRFSLEETKKCPLLHRGSRVLKYTFYNLHKSVVLNIQQVQPEIKILSLFIYSHVLKLLKFFLLLVKGKIKCFQAALYHTNETEASKRATKSTTKSMVGIYDTFFLKCFVG